mmetsp:Transcript_25225/g.57217  ORF Transcript_25225/g.57217 Transcript_25225/m.57217 type:complete len:222 (-) Transcript_25225:77-742(-)|eukprot:CAMPEP_0197930828 /NCGR_PEP_ID=MMETSP1439-20131203/106077_1 /TAXON_ID=66791 /ORGANISM="Gonyaulax spinifera, Strain CCMP409" /LENGTH=221 /DNA_ID=CAMNT_0043553535 /DNA_START=92 /DNA_END=757 /DNA_ORIENTATION=+
MPLAPLSARAVNTVLLTYEGRDKTFRFLQFASRALLGLTAGARSRYAKVLNTLALRIMVSIAGSRRSFRWGREIPIMLEIPRSLALADPVERVMDVLQKVTILMFFWTDHLGWLHQVRGGMKSGSGTIQRGLKWLTVSSIIAAISAVRRLRVLRAAEGAPGGQGAGADTERRATLVRAWRNGLLAVQTAHLSRIWESHDAIVGTLGMVTSTIDVLQVWPEK